MCKREWTFHDDEIYKAKLCDECRGKINMMSAIQDHVGWNDPEPDPDPG